MNNTFKEELAGSGDESGTECSTLSSDEDCHVVEFDDLDAILEEKQQEHEQSLLKCEDDSLTDETNDADTISNANLNAEGDLETANEPLSPETPEVIDHQAASPGTQDAIPNVSFTATAGENEDVNTFEECSMLRQKASELNGNVMKDESSQVQEHRAVPKYGKRKYHEEEITEDEDVRSDFKQPKLESSVSEETNHNAKTAVHSPIEPSNSNDDEKSSIINEIQQIGSRFAHLDKPGVSALDVASHLRMMSLHATALLRALSSTGVSSAADPDIATAIIDYIIGAFSCLLPLLCRLPVFQQPAGKGSPVSTEVLQDTLDNISYIFPQLDS